MLMFGISVGLFVLTLSGFIVMLGLWAYADAKVRTDKPGIWMLIVLLVPNLLGLIIYLLVGRTKMEKSSGKFKKPLIAFAISFMLAAGLMIGSFVSFMTADSLELPTWGGVSIGKVENYWNNQWTVSFKASGEELSKTISMNSGDLAAFHLMGNCDSGKLHLRISQGEIVKDIDISDNFNETVDLSEFQEGKIMLTIYNDEAKNASVSINWGK
ncbi:MAG: hypothetical protein LBU32_20580 [Clostridiales bacterium]|jgi:type III secretory pathway component EscS|nr:hypothetical protein [Clostridiales bacterium]